MSALEGSWCALHMGTPVTTTPDIGLLDVDDLAALWKVNKQWIYDHVERGNLPHLKLGRHLRFRPSDLAGMLEELVNQPAA